MKKVKIVVPIYKEKLNQYEIISINRLFEIYIDIDICFIHPVDLDISYYKEKFKFNFSFIKFENFFFKDLVGYNKLLLSLDFYKTFLEYNYVLIYQTDSYVFKNELVNWIEKKYDYIGGIWFEGYTNNPNDGAKVTFPGNGGFSLRNIQTIINCFESESNKISFLRLFNKNVYKIVFKNLKYGKLHFIKNNLFQRKGSILVRDLINNYNGNEDVFFIEISKLISNFNVPKVEDAIMFSWDRCPDYLFNKYKNFPMACHAWYRNDFPYQGNLDFWKNHIVI